VSFAAITFVLFLNECLLLLFHYGPSPETFGYILIFSGSDFVLKSKSTYLLHVYNIDNFQFS
jgi:hypothetical protein